MDSFFDSSAYLDKMLLFESDENTLVEDTDEQMRKFLMLKDFYPATMKKILLAFHCWHSNSGQACALEERRAEKQ